MISGNLRNWAFVIVFLFLIFQGWLAWYITRPNYKGSFTIIQWIGITTIGVVISTLVIG